MTRAPLDAATTELLTESLRELFGAHPDAADLGKALDELGWAEVLAEDPATATTLLFVEQGRALATSRALDDVLLAELAPALPRPAGPRAVLYPHPSEGCRPTAADAATRGILLGDLDGITEVVIPTSSDTGTKVAVVTTDAIAPLCTPIRGFDTASGWRLVTGRHPVPTENAIDAGPAWPRAVAAGHRALAAELLGCCAEALRIATAHTSARVQFGRPIASFQAVRHRLAECSVAVQGLRSVLEAAWSGSTASDGGLWAATVAKLQAGRAQAEVMRHAVQACGAMGLAAEGEIHRYVTRAAALDALLGGRLALGESMGSMLLAGTALDPVVDL